MTCDICKKAPQLLRTPHGMMVDLQPVTTTYNEVVDGGIVARTIEKLACNECRKALAAALEGRGAFATANETPA